MVYVNIIVLFEFLSIVYLLWNMMCSKDAVLADYDWPQMGWKQDYLRLR